LAERGLLRRPEMARPRHFSGKLNRQNRIFAYSAGDSLPMSILRPSRSANGGKDRHGGKITAERRREMAKANSRSELLLARDARAD